MSAGSNADSSPHTLLGSLKGLLARLRRRLPDGRVLQVEEIASAVNEHVRARALSGLALRYLPSSITVYVSPEDLDLLRPFDREVREAVMEVFRGLAVSPGSGWQLTADPVSVTLAAEEHLSPGGRPYVEHGYGPGIHRAEWRPKGSQEQGPSKSGLLRVVVTVAAEDGTALQQSFGLWLGRVLPAALVSDEPGSDGVLRINGGVVCDASGAPWEGASEAPRVLPPPEPSSRAVYLPSSWDGPWVDFGLPGGRRVIWCPGGAFVVGRDAVVAHVAVDPLQPTLSAPHLALWQGGTGFMAVDLATTNGTWLDGRRMDPGRPLRIVPPARLELGGEGRVTIELAGAALRSGRSQGARVSRRFADRGEV